jgi:hypothetical protein
MRRYTLTDGGKFGGDFLAYPGDPALYHAYYVVRVLPQGAALHPTMLLGTARGAHAARKHLLLTWVRPRRAQEGGSTTQQQQQQQQPGTPSKVQGCLSETADGKGGSTAALQQCTVMHEAQGLLAAAAAGADIMYVTIAKETGFVSSS